MKYIFIDANVYLSLYHFSDDDLNKLQALVDFRNAKRIKVLSNAQLINEFKRNREARIHDALKQFTPPSAGKIPRLFDQYKEESSELRRLIGEAGKLHAELIEKVRTDILEHSLKADKLMQQLIGEQVEELEPKLLSKANERVSVGNPPGKKGSIGDAYHWEYLLENVPEGMDLIVLTGDGDWISPVDQNKLSDFLEQEWVSKKKSTIRLYRSIASYFKEEHPEIRLESEYKKDLWIQDLAESISFDGSRLALRKLWGSGNFTDEQLKKIIEASITNGQVYNAHIYSPERVGKRLWAILDGRRPDVDETVWKDFCKKFEMPKSDEDEEQVNLDDIPF